MAKLIKKKDYYYLQESFRKGGKVITKEDYLGKEIPEKINFLKEEFEKKIRKERFEEDLFKIKKNFQTEFNQLPQIDKTKFLKNFAVKFTYNTQAIEGSTLTLKDTRFLVEEGISPLKPIKDVEETKEHHKLFLEMLEYKKDLTSSLCLFWHKKLFERTYPEISGKIRKHNVAISDSKVVFPDNIEVDYLLEEFYKWYNKNKNKFNPVELASLVHLKFVSIHPFSDGNGRMSRLLMNFILYKNNFPLLDIPYTQRQQYYNSLEKSQIKNEANHFILFIIKKFIKDYKKYIV